MYGVPISKHHNEGMYEHISVHSKITIIAYSGPSKIGHHGHHIAGQNPCATYEYN